MKTRNIFLNVVLGLCCLFAIRSKGQSIVQPSNPDEVAAVMTCMGNPFYDWMENSIMNYNTGPTDNLLALTWYNRQTGCVELTFSEDGGTTWIPQVFNPTGSSYSLSHFECPNVLIGGPYGSGSDYIVAVVYKALNFFTGFQVYMDLYTISNPGSSGFSYSCTVRLSDPSFSNRGIGDVKCDAITKDISGTLQADNFVVAWGDQAVTTGGGGTGLTAFYGSLSGIQPNCTLGTFNRYSSSNLTGNLPIGHFDVAGYEGSASDTAIFTFETGFSVVWGKWETNNTTGLSSGPTTMLAGTPSAPAYSPRVDAMDPYTVNSGYPGTFFTSTYGYNAGGPTNYVNYYNLTAGNNVATSTLSGFGYDAGFWPTVACGPNSPDQYSICYVSANSMSNPNVLLQTIDASTGGLYSADYYRVDLNSPNVNLQTEAISNDWIMSLGGPIANSNFISWTTDDTVKYKITNSATTPSFKPTTVGSIAMAHKYSLNPSPAKDEINVKGLNASSDYTITDITGRAVKTGNVKESAPHIDISVLSSGMYILNIGENEKIKFVKQ